MRQRHFDGANSKPQKTPENAQTPTSQVHAVLGGVLQYLNAVIKSDQLDIRHAFSSSL
jgi:hypothetical protein